MKKNSDLVQPKMVSIYELREKLLPLIGGYKWAEDALMDLWKLGAPDPSPFSMPCSNGVCWAAASGEGLCGKFGCRREKRLLMPTQFAVWWTDVSNRQGLELKAVDALKANAPRSGDWL